jgi:hypothetical protein
MLLDLFVGPGAIIEFAAAAACLWATVCQVRAARASRRCAGASSYFGLIALAMLAGAGLSWYFAWDKGYQELAAETVHQPVPTPQVAHTAPTPAPTPVALPRDPTAGEVDLGGYRLRGPQGFRLRGKREMSTNDTDAVVLTWTKAAGDDWLGERFMASFYTKREGAPFSTHALPAMLRAGAEGLQMAEFAILSEAIEVVPVNGLSAARVRFRGRLNGKPVYGFAYFVVEQSRSILVRANTTDGETSDTYHLMEDAAHTLRYVGSDEAPGGGTQPAAVPANPTADRKERSPAPSQFAARLIGTVRFRILGYPAQGDPQTLAREAVSGIAWADPASVTIDRDKNEVVIGVRVMSLNTASAKASLEQRGFRIGGASLSGLPPRASVPSLP